MTLSTFNIISLAKEVTETKSDIQKIWQERNPETLHETLYLMSQQEPGTVNTAQGMLLFEDIAEELRDSNHSLSSQIDNLTRMALILLPEGSRDIAYNDICDLIKARDIYGEEKTILPQPEGIARKAYPYAAASAMVHAAEALIADKEERKALLETDLYHIASMYGADLRLNLLYLTIKNGGEMKDTYIHNTPEKISRQIEALKGSLGQIPVNGIG
jgi:hypothetical protein